MADQTGQRLLVRRIESEQALERFRRLLVVQELFVVKRGNSLPERHFLARRGRHLHLLGEVFEQILEAAEFRVQTVETAERLDTGGVEFGSRLEALQGLV